MSDDCKKTPQPTTRPAGDVETAAGDVAAEGGRFAREVFRRAIDALHKEWRLALEQSK